MTSTCAQDAEETAAFLLERIRAARGKLWDEGPRLVPLAPADPAAPALNVFAARRIRGISPRIAGGLLAWARGERPVDVVRYAPAAVDVLHWQAAGRRCVSLLDDATAHAHGSPLHPDGLSFALHDLHHLEKFVDPAHHAGQVGFFRCMAHALADDDVRALQHSLDDTWACDRDAVIADMNGSAVFLFAVLKMRLAMAVRRRLAVTTGRPAPVGGPLDDAERAAFAPVLDRLLRAMGLPADLRGHAAIVSARRAHDPGSTNPVPRRLLTFFESAAMPSRRVAAG